MPGFNIGGGTSLWQKSSTLRTTGDVHRAHRWAILDLLGLFSTTDNTTVYAKECTLPEFGLEEEQMDGASVKYKIATGATFNDVTVVFYDVYKLFNKLKEAHRAAWTPETGLSPANNYMGQVRYGQRDGRGAFTDIYTLRNAWIKRIAHSNLTYESSDIKVITLTIAYTWADHEPQ
jgi:hypothetical protein